MAPSPVKIDRWAVQRVHSAQPARSVPLTVAALRQSLLPLHPTPVSSPRSQHRWTAETTEPVPQYGSTLHGAERLQHARLDHQCDACMYEFATPEEMERGVLIGTDNFPMGPLELNGCTLSAYAGTSDAEGGVHHVQAEWEESHD